MIIYKPDWVAHYVADKKKKGCIYSVAVHPDGARLATGGLDTKVKIWNTAPIFDSEKEDDDSIHKLLCTMTMHNGAVLCVRWSNHDGRYLASGSDNDNLIIIWELDIGAGGFTTFGSTDVNVETWRAVKYLRGHESDVQDLAWSRDNQYLASCGVDGHVFVWDGRSFDRVVKLDQHQGFVKGITWDPVGKFLASQSDDKSVKIWRTSDWGLEKDIREPYAAAPGTTFFRRLSWSPEGSHIATANAVNGPVTIAAVIAREAWKADISLVGHDLPVEVAKFNPCLFYFADDKNNSNTAIAASPTTGTMASVCALGSQDRSVSIWVTRYSRPLFVATDIFENNVYDLAWSPNGRHLVACSQDGTIACLQFEQELGTPITPEETEKILAKYGYKRKGAILAENPEQLALEEEHAVATKNLASSRIANLMGANTNGITSGPSTPGPMDMTASPDRAFVTPAPPVATGVAMTFGSSNTPHTPIQQKVTIGLDGKKRIQPQFVSGLSGVAAPMLWGGGTPQTSMTPLGAYVTPQIHAFGPSQVAPTPLTPAEMIEMDTPSRAMPQGGILTLGSGNKRKDPPAQGGDQDVMTPAKRGAVSTPGSIGKGKQADREEEDWEAPLPSADWMRSVVLPSTIERSQVRLGVPKVKSHLMKTIGGSTVSLECQNSQKKGEPNKVICSSKGDLLWIDYLPSAILLLVGEGLFEAVGCEDGTVYIYSPAGRRLLPPLVLEATPSYMAVAKHWLMCLTATGLLYVWDVARQTALLHAVSVAPVLQLATLPDDDHLHDTPTIREAFVRDNGVPILVTSHQQAFAYHVDMRVWTRIAEPWFAGSEFFGSAARMGKAGVLASLERSALATAAGEGGRGAGAFARQLMKKSQKAQSVLTMDHLETQLAASEILNSPSEFRHWLRCYAQRLADEGAKARVEELCKDLLGPVFSSSQSKMEWCPTIVGVLSKRELLQEILPILGNNRAMQRIVTEYKMSLDKVMVLGA